MLKRYETIIKGSLYKEILIDTTLYSNNINHVIIFSHGFKGFKDWGPFNKIAEHFAYNGFIFVKFNFSHNGTSIENPSDFVDLDAFGNNNFCLELDDLGLVINWVEDNFSSSKITLFGHSRGGAISILKSNEDNRVSKIVSWASPSDFLAKLPAYGKAETWQELNVIYIHNARTKQKMPLYYQFYENCLENIDRLNIKHVLSNIIIPHLHIHGDADPTVLVDEAYNIKNWSSNTHLHIVKEANHVFNAFHPYDLDEFPKNLMEAIDTTVTFLKE